MTAYPELLILRHGETEWNRSGRLQGELDSHLTDTGRDQAQCQGRILKDVGISGWAVYCSPQGRAAETAALALPELPVVSDARLREIGLGEWSGQLREDLAAQFPELFAGDGLEWYDHAPGGEGIAALESRAASFLSELNGPSVIVTHGITSRVLRCLLVGLPAESFGTVGGGQGVVYHLRDGRSRLLT
ncbi:histidine phosphatase family protein [Sedimentitalea sp. JM2-8]|uniref:Histidine phosphatase family protein n=1 Tax=Sedimentitalea xiamensis TaxID=3050037 RepID=A0ABT7FA80_9RHOB|nr:histidine phosphatase family protein [Sedimentitalea xiamensis]MDK3072009.1 histidine phosphatase family protein [Sedimentitalea xiamensis]